MEKRRVDDDESKGRRRRSRTENERGTDQCRQQKEGHLQSVANGCLGNEGDEFHDGGAARGKVSTGANMCLRERDET